MRTALAFLFLTLVLLAPNEFELLPIPAAYLRIPGDALMAITLVLLLPRRIRPAATWTAGVALGLLAALKAVSIGFSAVLGRPFDPVMDWSFLRAAAAFLDRSLGRAGATGVEAGVALIIAALLVAVALSFRRVAGLALRDKRTSSRAVALFACAWVACVVTGVQAVPQVPVAGHESFDRVTEMHASLHDREIFAAQSKVDFFRDVPGDNLLQALRGKDVIVGLVESYGRAAVEDHELAPLLDNCERRLRRAGFTSRSAFLTSSTVGGGSWLAQATLLSGLWVDSHQRYRDLVEGDRFTLNGAFRRAGWRTVAVMPANTTAWPEAAFYGFDRVYGAEDLGYRGPKFGFGTVPDQFTLSVFQRSELAAPGRPPVMALIPLISSHAPWRPVPSQRGWEGLGDGSGFEIEPGSGEEGQTSLSGDREQIRADYRRAVGYSVASLVSYVVTYGDDDLVLVLLGDHQPAPIITGSRAGRDVPVTVVARDPEVMRRVEEWGWREGVRPQPGAPVWRMDSFRDRFLTAFAQ